MTNRYFMASLTGHIFIIIILVFFPWGSKKNNPMETIQVVDAGGLGQPPPVNVQQGPVQPKEEVVIPPEKDEIKIPDKKPPKVKKVTPKEKQKPQPKVETQLKNKLSKLMEETDQKTNSEATDDVKKNLTDREDLPDKAPSN